VIALPAIDLREGACVQLVGGSYAAERVRIRDVVAVASRWRDAGFSRLHVVDLDAATGAGSNHDVILRLLDSGDDVQVGGGVRTSDDVARLLGAGASRVVVGTRALEESRWIERTSARFPDRIIVAADVRANVPVVRGWSRPGPESLDALIERLAALPLAGLLVTAVDVEGQLAGPHLALVDHVRSRSMLPLIASGGITTMQDLQALARCGADAAVIGMALYQGVLDPAAVAAEFGR
jgi:phosphoribosylformimino-5-aminoimidazole carboxamide ribotide isomerase